MKKIMAIISLAIVLAMPSCKSTSSTAKDDAQKADPASHAVAVSLPPAGSSLTGSNGQSLAQEYSQDYTTLPSEATGAGQSLAQEYSQDYTTVVPMHKSDSKPRNLDGSNGTVNTSNGAVSMIPKATAFRMSGDYANNVAVTVDAQGNLTYFPAPTDITSASAPVALADGWWLNRQGIGINSVFTKYTFEEYAALPSVPTVAELKAAIIPGARVTEIVTLPYTINDASSNIPAINDLLKSIK